MPELPEVETIVRGLRGAISGRVVSELLIDRADVIRHGLAELRASLIGRRISRLDREAKRIRIHLHPAGLIVVHLGMSGRLTLDSLRSPLLAHTHVRMRLKGLSDEVRFRDPRRFGGIWFFTEGLSNGALKPLGPDALTIRVPVLREITRRRRQIKALLMDQHAIGGLGNIYCDEALFRARLHPLTTASSMTHQQVKNLACSIRKVLHASLESGGSTLNDYRRSDGSEGAFQNLLRVYGREGEPCRRCGTKIKSIIAAGRSTHFCPRCQRPKRPSGVRGDARRS